MQPVLLNQNAITKYRNSFNNAVLIKLRYLVILCHDSGKVYAEITGDEVCAIIKARSKSHDFERLYSLVLNYPFPRSRVRNCAAHDEIDMSLLPELIISWCEQFYAPIVVYFATTLSLGHRNNRLCLRISIISFVEISVVLVAIKEALLEYPLQDRTCSLSAGNEGACLIQEAQFIARGL
jgi:hypothetical protein